MLKTTGLTLHYGGSQVLHGIDFEAKAGEVTCIMGTNGVGKTSFLKALAGTHPRSGGSVEIAGERIGMLRPQDMARRGLAMVPQGRMIFPLLTVQENLETAYALLPRSDWRIPAEVFDLFPVLKDMARRRGGDLSGGQQQQLAIARAIIMRPKSAAAGRADRRYSAQHHPADQPGDRISEIQRRNCSGACRAIFRFCLRLGRPVLHFPPWQYVPVRPGRQL